MIDKIINAIRHPGKREWVWYAALLFVPLFLFLLVLVPGVRNVLIHIDSLVRGKPLNEEVWQMLLPQLFSKLLLVCVSFTIALLLLHVLLLEGKPARIIVLGFFTLYLIVTFISALLHEPWFDEVYAWKLAHDYSVAGLFRYMRYEGHFLPWYLLLMPFAKIGFPLQTLCFVSWALNAAGATVFMVKTPFHPFAKIIALCTSPLLFWYPVVSRPYVLLSLILFFIAALYSQRNEKPIVFAVLIALLANTHAYIEGLVGILFLFFLVEDTIYPWKTYSSAERHQHVIGLIIIIAGVLIAFAQVAPAFVSSSLLDRAKTPIPGIDGITGFLSGSDIPRWLWIPFAVCLVAAIIWMAIKNKKAAVMLTVTYAYMILFAFLIYGAGVPNRAFLWFIVLIFVLWISETLSVRSISILLTCFSLFILNPRYTIRDFHEDFSCIHATFSYIQEQYPAGTDVYFSRQFVQEFYLQQYNCHPITETEKFLAEPNRGNTPALIVVMNRKEDEGIIASLETRTDARYIGDFGGLIWGSLKLYEVGDVQ